MLKERTEIDTARQHSRDEFTEKLRAAYPDPGCSIRQQCELMFDHWWPGTRESAEQ